MFHDRTSTGGPTETNLALDAFPSPADLWARYAAWKGLTPEAEQTMANQVRWLQEHPNQTVSIEGHADERGTREYNIALGAKRAQSVRDFLGRNGVNGQRIRTISFGKERPVAVCNDISCWSQNRRAQTVLNNRTAAAQQ